MITTEESLLKQAEVVLTQACTLRCSSCFEKKWGYHAESTMAIEDLKKIVDFCNESGVKYLFLTGGEPLLYPHLIEILEYIQNKGYSLKPTIATNGLKLADENIAKQLIKAGIVYIDISLKGSSSEEWIKSTGYDGYAMQIKAIRNLASLPIDFTCSMVVTMNNIQSVCNAVQHALDNGGRQFSFTFEIDNDNTNSEGTMYLRNHNPQTLISAFLAQANQLDNITNDWWIEYSFPLCVYTKEQLNRLHGKLASPCQVHLQDAVTFSPSMDLLSCDMFMDESLGRLGRDFNTYEEFLKWRSHAPYHDAVNKLRRYPSNECSDCVHLSACLGGCPVLWKHYSLAEIKNI